MAYFQSSLTSLSYFLPNLSLFPPIHQMEGMNGLVSFPTTMYHSLNQDEAIRRFCPARLEEHGHDAWEFEALSLTLDEINELWGVEEDHFVNGFFNMDSHTTEESANQQCDPLWHSLATDDVYKDIPMMIEVEGDGDGDIEMSSGWCEEAQYLVPMYDSTTTTTRSIQEEVSHGVEDQGLHLVHLLLACAEAVGCRDTQLAHSLLTQIWSCCNPWPCGDSMQRVSYCFAMGLSSRLSLLHNLNPNGTFSNGACTDASLITTKQKIEAFHLLHQKTPYIVFGFMAANDAICQSAQGKEYLHILDLAMEHTFFQWPSLITSLASRTGGPPKLVRVTGIVGNQDMMLELESSMKGIVGQASSMGVVMELRMIAGPATTTLLTRQHLDLREKEVLFVNSILHLHTYVKESRGSLKAILEAIKKLGPTLLTVVEQDANHNGPLFLGRFVESLHYYSAVFDSLEGRLARNSVERMKIEKVHYGEEIRNIVGYEGIDRIERHERADQWRRQIGRAGFQMVGFKDSSTRSQVEAMVGGCGDGYTVTSEKGCLLLGWRGRPIMLAAAWQLPNNKNKNNTWTYTDSILNCCK